MNLSADLTVGGDGRIAGDGAKQRFSAKPTARDARLGAAVASGTATPAA